MPSILQVLSTDARFSALADAVRRAGLERTLSESGPMTLFAPTNEAFDSLAGDRRDELLGSARLEAVLRYHLIDARLDRHFLVRSATATTLHGERLQFTFDEPMGSDRDQQIYVNGARIAMSDVQATNGIIYPIDEVLSPPRT